MILLRGLSGRSAWVAYLDEDDGKTAARGLSDNMNSVESMDI